jgi:Spx/MgsR family transcriptional regulator
MRWEAGVSLTLFGIKACDTMKKARAWLEGRGLAYRFHDYKAEGVDAAHLTRWCAAAGWERVLNRTGTTFRALGDAEKADLTQARAIGLMCAQPSMIKRPVLEGRTPDGRPILLIGFKPDVYASAFDAA